jgi:hypothetical protein
MELRGLALQDYALTNVIEMDSLQMELLLKLFQSLKIFADISGCLSRYT